jgi:hypothetical protein
MFFKAVRRIKALSDESKANLLSDNAAGKIKLNPDYIAHLQDEEFSVFYNALCVIYIVGPASVTTLDVDAVLAASYIISQEAAIVKHLRLFPRIACFIVSLYCLIFSFPGVSIAEEPLESRTENCVNCCNGKKQTCFNIYPDRRLCEAEFQECVNTCNSEGNHSSEWSDCWSQSDK